ncbi:hypothetical protein HOF40_01420 [Candidatus Parcubacteria bacterium]|mgnify:CR=1 FL=1|jgi:hypothetical protein|nr:hypothetical protein [Candidatus Parcubacteria bacterium]MBT3948726.1 hypothetical protein [Candidatus Parcubacteria bacterium]
MNNKLEIQEFFVEGNDQQTSHVLLHLAEPVTQEEKEKGYFFALIEINESHHEQITQLQEIIDSIETAYYETEGIEDETFEHIIQEINRQSHHILGYKESEINALVGTLNNSRLVLAYHGSPQALLYYTTPDGLRETPIIDGDTNNAHQLFSAVVEGTISRGDFVYITTPHVNDYFSSDRVRKILQSRTTRQSSMHIGKVLESLKNEYSFGGILFHTPKSVQPISEELDKKERVGSQASLDNFLDTAKATEETLSPPLMKHATSKVKDVFQKFASGKNKRVEKAKKRSPETKTTRHGNIETNYRPSPGQSQENWTGRLLILLGRGIVLLGTGLFVVSKKILEWTISFLQHSFYFITNKNGKRTLTIDSSKSYIDNKRHQVRHMGMVSKVLFIALLVFVVIFIGSITYIKIREGREVKQVQYTTLIETITEKRDEAESRLLYGEDEKALELLNEASKLTETLPAKKDVEKETSQNLRQSIDELLQKLRKITAVDSELIVDLSSLQEQASSSKIIPFDEKILAYGPEDETLYTIDPITKNIEQKKHETIGQLLAADVPKEDDKAVFISYENNIVELEKESKGFSNKDISYPVDNPPITDISIYNRRTYLLSSNNDQIYKHNPIQTGYDRGTEWVTNKTDSLSEARSLTVDGDIYVLTNNTILKFFAGTQQGFEIRGLDPALENPTEIWTYADVNNLYILEPTNKRVIVIDKEGNFVGQYTSDVWKNPTSMIVQEDEKTIYVLDENKIYKFNF